MLLLLGILTHSSPSSVLADAVIVVIVVAVVGFDVLVPCKFRQLGKQTEGQTEFMFERHREKNVTNSMLSMQGTRKYCVA